MARIEEGCMAIVVKGECESNIGKMVTVGRFIGKLQDDSWDFPDDLWEVSQSMVYTNGEQYPYSSEKNLDRIDDDLDEIEGFDEIKLTNEA